MESQKTTTIKTSKSTRATIIVPTLLEAVERVIAAAKDSEMDDFLLFKVELEIGLLAEGYGITHNQAILFCVCLETGPCRIKLKDIYNYLNIDRFDFIHYYSDIDALVDRGLLHYHNANDKNEFDIPLEVINMLIRNEYYDKQILLA